MKPITIINYLLEKGYNLADFQIIDMSLIPNVKFDYFFKKQLKKDTLIWGPISKGIDKDTTPEDGILIYSENLIKDSCVRIDSVFLVENNFVFYMKF